MGKSSKRRDKKDKGVHITQSPVSHFKECVFYFKEFEKRNGMDWITFSRIDEKGTKMEAELAMT